MANEAKRCCFQWDVCNPFIPCRDLNTWFRYGSPNATLWTITLKTIDLGIDYWDLSLSIASDRHCEIVADSVLISISLNGTEITENKRSYCCFFQANDFTYSIQKHADMRRQTVPHRLFVKVEISLQERATGNGVIANADDLRWLSNDMKQLLKDPQYSNLQLVPKNSSGPVSAHSYILDARWEQYKKLPVDEASKNVVVTNISRGLLLDILTYLYSGELTRTWPDWLDLSYTTELFQVMDRYELKQLNGVFEKSDVKQKLIAMNPVYFESRLFLLDCINGRPIKNASCTWHVDQKPEYDLIFQIHVRTEDRAGPWLSYTLHSKSPSTVYFQVVLEVIKRVEGNALQKVTTVHQRDGSIDPDATEESKQVLFLGCPETFDIDSTSSDGAKFFIRCVLSVTDGSTLGLIQSEDDHSSLRGLERIHLLSSHMHVLKRKKKDTDMRILSRSPGPEVLEEVEEVERIHKGILAVRAPLCCEGLEDGPGENVIPMEARTTLSSETLPMVLNYLHTGKMFRIPKHLLEEVELFAKRTSFNSLLDLASRVRATYN